MQLVPNVLLAAASMAMYLKKYEGVPQRFIAVFVDNYMCDEFVKGANFKQNILKSYENEKSVFFANHVAVHCIRIAADYPLVDFLLGLHPTETFFCIAPLEY